MEDYNDLDTYDGDTVHDIWVDLDNYENTGLPDVFEDTDFDKFLANLNDRD